QPTPGAAQQTYQRAAPGSRSASLRHHMASASATRATRSMKATSPADYRELARRRLPKFLFEYIDGGSNAELTLRHNISELERVALRQRVLRDVSTLDL